MPVAKSRMTSALIAAGAKVDDPSPEDGTPLVVAAHSGREKLALFLLDKGADPKATDAFGITALHYALYGGLRAILAPAGFLRRPPRRIGGAGQGQLRLAHLVEPVGKGHVQLRIL